MTQERRTMTPDAVLQNAARAGDLDAIRKAVADGADPKAFGSDGLYWSVRLGHIECARFLIPISDPKERDSEMLRLTAEARTAEFTRLLLPVSDVETARARLTEDDETEALAFLDAVIQEEKIRAKHIKHSDRPIRNSI